MANRADKQRFHYIYKITRNDGSGKYYIGMHSTDNLEDGYFGSGKLLWSSIRRHGKEIHSKEIIEFLPSRKDLKARERELVNVEVLKDECCMNLQIGGGGGFSAQSHQLKCIQGARQWHTNIAGTEKAREIACKNVETRKLRNSSWRGGNTSKARATSNTPEAIEKRKATFTERAHQQGEKNSQFGTCWVTNGVKSIKIKKEQLSEYLTDGYCRGRKFATSD